MGIEAEIGDAVAGLDAVFAKRASQALAPLAELAIGKLACSRDDPDFVREQIHGAVETPDGCQRDKHGGIVLLTASVRFQYGCHDNVFIRRGFFKERPENLAAEFVDLAVGGYDFARRL